MCCSRIDLYCFLNDTLVFLAHFKLIHFVLSAFLENTAKSNGSAQFLQSAVDLH